MAQEHWADNVVKRVIAQKGDKDKYVVAAGITPSGTIHIGNFREIITVDLVARALKDAGKKVRFIYSWDDYDVFRKVPKNMPKQDMLEKNLRKPIVDIEDPYGTEKSYARHHEVELENDVSNVGIHPEFLYQAEKYRAGEYIEGMRTALQKTELIKKILNKHRKEPLADDWLPISGYCPECDLDEVHFSEYDGDYGLKMHCRPCNKDLDVDLRKAPFLKLPWRVDWPMRWAHEQVDFEPGGKDHSTPGGSYDTGKDLVKLYDWTAPAYQMYDFVIAKGVGGKISSSKGNVITLGDCLKIYEPQIIRWFFAGTRPKTEFSISFDLDVINVYEEFDKVERIAHKAQKASDQEYAKQRRIYELSCVGEHPKKLPFQPSFRHLTNVLLVHELDVNKAIGYYESQLEDEEDRKRLHQRAICAKNWIENHAPDDFKYSVNDVPPKDVKLSTEMVQCFKDVADQLEAKDWMDKDLHLEFYVITKNNGVDSKDFFEKAYQVLISRPKGPKLANFILTIGKERVIKIFNQL